jgi:hypothetical protein
MLENEYKYFEEHYEDIKKKFLDKFIVIIGEKVIGAYESQKEALAETLKTHKLGTFLVQKVTEKPQDIIHRFTSRVYV